MIYSGRDINELFARAEYFLPKREALLEKLRERKFIPMQVAQQRYADFVTGNMDDFLRYLRASNVRNVMYSYRYYSESEIEEMFRLEERDKALFCDCRYSGPHRRTIIRNGYNHCSTYSDYAFYLQYSKYVMQHIDLSRPNELRLYALVQGRVIACQLGDAWIERLDLVTRNVLRKYAMEQNLGAGSFVFGFYG